MEDSAAQPSTLTGTSAAGVTGVGSNLQIVGDSTELTVLASSAATPEMLPAAVLGSDSQAASAFKVLTGQWCSHHSLQTCRFVCRPLRRIARVSCAYLFNMYNLMPGDLHS